MAKSSGSLIAGSAVCSEREGGYPIISRAEGIYYYDSKGKRYIDGSGSTSAVTCIGHGVAEVPAAMAAQAKAFACNPSHATVNRPAMDLADLLAAHAPGGLRDNCKVWFAVTGTDATDDAVRLARQHWVEKGQASKYIVISRWQSYHGMNIGSAGYSGHTSRRTLFTPMFVNSPHIAPAYCYRCSLEQTYPRCRLLCARQLETVIRQTGPENVAAFIAEPVGGAALGAVPAPDGYFEVLRDICSRYQVLFIADEVMTGFGRTGKLWGIEHWEATPDMVATAKGITGGHAPLAALIASDAVWEPLLQKGSPFRSGHTMSANAVCCAAGLATLQYILAHDLAENARVVGAHFHQRLHELLRYPIVGDVRGLGMMVGFELVQDKASKKPFPPEKQVSQAVFRAAMERGLIVYPLTGCVDGVEGNMVKLCPPLVATREQIDEIMEILHEAVASVCP